MPISDGSPWNLIFQIPVAAVIIVVVVLFLRFIRETNASYMTAQAKQQDVFMTAIKEQREANNTALNKVAEGFTNLSQSISDRLEEMAVVKATSRSRK